MSQIKRNEGFQTEGKVKAADFLSRNEVIYPSQPGYNDMLLLERKYCRIARKRAAELRSQGKSIDYYCIWISEQRVPYFSDEGLPRRLLVDMGFYRDSRKGLSQIL